MQIKAFVVRIWRDECGAMRGQVTDPQTLQRVPFRDSAELWQLIQTITHDETKKPNKRQGELDE